MRKTSLDEFPQFLNVLIGDMSFIGPRPKLYQGDEIYRSFNNEYKQSFEVKPGITGYAQAFFRNSITQDEKFHWDAYYAENLSFMMDVKIILHTIYSVIARKNINTEQSYTKQ
jgi:lipopolysaccharide/colanic/teichoic acid biosynthesis glycosyltransferase